MPSNNSTKVIGYYDEEEGDIYCLRHGRNSMLPIMEKDEDYFGKCNVCGEIIDPRDSEQDFDD
jgi:hypothetical protein